MSTVSAPTVTRQQLEDLPELERQMLEVTAVSMVSITRTQTATAIKYLGGRDARGRQLTPARLEGPGDALEARGLFDGHHDPPFSMISARRSSRSRSSPGARPSGRGRL